jgi:hypothetical protein
VSNSTTTEGSQLHDLQSGFAFSDYKEYAKNVSRDELIEMLLNDQPSWVGILRHQ